MNHSRSGRSGRRSCVLTCIADSNRVVRDFRRCDRSTFSTYAGPCCYGHPDDIGDAVIYLDPSSEHACRGDVSPFDTGALERGYLKPWGRDPVAERWRRLSKHSFALPGWRNRFADWLNRSYVDPHSYYGSLGDRMADGLPDRSPPAPTRLLVAHNGHAGSARYQGNCADRRAWIWEVRVRGELSYDHLAGGVLHVAFHRLEEASEFRRLYARRGVAFDVRTLGQREVVNPDAFYRASGGIIRTIVRGAP